MKSKNLGWIALVLLAGPMTASAVPIVWNEQGSGAGSSIATAQVIIDTAPNSLAAINGTLNAINPVVGSPFYEVDIYQIRIIDVGSFSARSVSGNPDDTALFLFDSAGLGVYMNDDTTTDLLAFLPSGDPAGPASNGLYYIAVALGGTEAFDASAISSFLAGGFTDIRGGNVLAGALDSWSPTFQSGNELLTYSIEFTGAAVAFPVPEPSTLALLLFGLVAVTLSRRRSANRLRC